MNKRKFTWWSSTIILLTLIIMSGYRHIVRATTEVSLFSPDDPSNLQPLNQIFSFGQPVTMSWQATANVDFCKVLVYGPDPGVEAGSEQVRGTMTFLANNLKKGSHIWNVACFDRNGIKKGESNGLFHVDHKTAPNIPTNLHPADVSLPANQPVTLSWETDDTATDCHLELFRPGSGVIQTGRISQRSYSTDTGSTAGKFHWQVECFNSMGVWSSWTNASFDVGATATPTPVPVKPVLIYVHGWQGLDTTGGKCPDKVDATTVKKYDPSNPPPSGDPDDVPLVHWLQSDGYDVWMLHWDTNADHTDHIMVAAGCLADQFKFVKGQSVYPSGTEFIPIAHSMGGVVTRYYLESGKYQDATKGIRSLSP
jgi:hypothetical protein